MPAGDPGRRLPGHPAAAHRLRKHLAGAARRASSAIGTARASAATLISKVPGTIDATRAGALTTTSALQTLPDPTLRWLAATSVGLGAGLHLAGAPRLVSAAGVAPALMIGAALLLRPVAPAVPAGAKR